MKIFKWLRLMLLSLGLCAGVSTGLLADDGSIYLEGDFTQGGLIRGKVTPGSTVGYEGRALRVGPDGRFIFGFHRDDAKDHTLEVTDPDGKTTLHQISISQREYDIQRIDGLPPKKVTPPESLLKRIRAEGQRVREARAIDSDFRGFDDGFIWPVKGRISGVFGSQRVLNGQPRQPHYGIDIAVPTGTPFVTPAAGTVTLVEPDLYYSGGTVMVDHGYGLASTFLHIEEIKVELGQKLKQGDIVGTVGATGRATGPHLDWRVNWFDDRLDAGLLVPPMS